MKVVYLSFKHGLKSRREYDPQTLRCVKLLNMKIERKIIDPDNVRTNLVCYELAVLANKIGYNELTEYGYDSSKKLDKPYYGDKFRNSDGSNNLVFSAPTIMELKEYISRSFGLIIHTTPIFLSMEKDSEIKYGSVYYNNNEDEPPFPVDEEWEELDTELDSIENELIHVIYREILEDDELSNYLIECKNKRFNTNIEAKIKSVK